MLRTLAINSNKKCVKFWCFDSFLITKANLKLRRVIWNPCKEYTQTGRPDTPSEGVRTTYPDRICTRLPPICTRLPLICTRLPPFYTRLPPICTWLPPFCTRLPPICTRLLPICTRLLPLPPECSRPEFWRQIEKESFAGNFVQCCGVLLKLPNICHQYFGIFWDILL